MWVSLFVGFHCAGVFAYDWEQSRAVPDVALWMQAGDGKIGFYFDGGGVHLPSARPHPARTIQPDLL